MDYYVHNTPLICVGAAQVNHLIQFQISDDCTQSFNSNQFRVILCGSHVVQIFQYLLDWHEHIDSCRIFLVEEHIRHFLGLVFNRTGLILIRT
jgi:hypothetical protein